MTTNDGGPAFPTTYDGEYLGMSLRDWFAGQALAGIAGHLSEMMAEDGLTPTDVAHGVNVAASFAYGLADAMIAARGAK